MRTETSDQPRRRRTADCFRFGLLAGVVLACIAATQSGVTVRMTRFSKPEFYDPPNETQIKWLLQGAEAEPDLGGLINIKELQLQTFSEKGEPEVVVRSPHCVLDGKGRTAYSDGKLQVEAVDGSFRLEGIGFIWQQTNHNLTISNRVRAVINLSASRKAKP